MNPLSEELMKPLTELNDAIDALLKVAARHKDELDHLRDWQRRACRALGYSGTSEAEIMQLLKEAEVKS